jgi:hypothetical protein
MIDWLIRRAKRTPYYHLDGYMNRWWLVPYNVVITRRGCDSADGTGPVSFWRRPLAWVFQRFDIAIRIHELLRADRGRHPHNHPWPYWSVVLKGGYLEEVYDAQGALIGTVWHGPGSVFRRPADSWHKIVDVDPGTTTLFITGKKAQTWGFNVDGVVVPYYEYAGEP